MTGWQPIETAKKEGYILAAFPRRLPYVAFWVEAENAWCVPSTTGLPGSYMGGRAIPHPQPTHWQSLPASPGEQT